MMLTENYTYNIISDGMGQPNLGGLLGYLLSKSTY